MHKSLFMMAAFLLLQMVSFSQAAQHYPVRPGRPTPQPVRPPGNGGRWMPIGTIEARLHVKRDVVNVTGNNMFQAIRFQVSRNPVEIYDMSVVFQNGQQHKFLVKNTFQPGSQSRVLALPGNRRFIKQIIVDYRSGGHIFNQRAYIEFFGQI